MRAGKLRDRIGFESKTTVDLTQTWVATGNQCYASIEPLSARELLQGAQTHSTITHRIRIRYQAGITAGLRIWVVGTGEFSDEFNQDEFDTYRYLSITSVIDVGNRHKELELLAEEVS